MRKRDNKIRVSGIYKIENIVNGCVYIGNSIDIESRIKKHKSKLKNNTHINSDLQKDWNLYGEEKFSFSIIEQIKDMSIIYDKEKEYISKYQYVYNKSDPESEFGKIQYKKKTSIVRKGRGKVEDYMRKKFKDILQKVYDECEREEYFDKRRSDKWFIENLKPHFDYINEDSLQKSIDKIYNEIGLQMADVKLYKYQFRNRGIFFDDEAEKVLVTRAFSRVLYAERTSYYKELRNKNKNKVE